MRMRTGRKTERRTGRVLYTAKEWGIESVTLRSFGPVQYVVYFEIKLVLQFSRLFVRKVLFRRSYYLANFNPVEVLNESLCCSHPLPPSILQYIMYIYIKYTQHRLGLACLWPSYWPTRPPEMVEGGENQPMRGPLVATPPPPLHHQASPVTSSENTSNVIRPQTLSIYALKNCNAD